MFSEIIGLQIPPTFYLDSYMQEVLIEPCTSHSYKFQGDCGEQDEHQPSKDKGRER